MNELSNMDYLTSREVAALLRVSIMTISRLVRRGVFPNAIKTSPVRNSYYRIPRSDVESYIESQKQGENPNA